MAEHIKSSKIASGSPIRPGRPVPGLGHVFFDLILLARGAPDQRGAQTEKEEEEGGLGLGGIGLPQGPAKPAGSKNNSAVRKQSQPQTPQSLGQFGGYG